MLMMAMTLNGSSNCGKQHSGLSNAIRVPGECGARLFDVLEVNACDMTDVSVVSVVSVVV